jgi:acetyltransferase-like isoleucine patch superfamily enzyme
MIEDTAKIYPNVTLGKNVVIEDYCIIGAPFKGQQGEPTVIGDNALIRSHTTIYAGNRIGNNLQTGNGVNIRELNEIGHNVTIGTHSVIEHHVLIGDHVRIHSLAFIPEFTRLEESCWIGPCVTVTNAKYPKSPDVKERLHGPVVRKNAKVGANVTLLPGVTIGESSLVAAGSVVTRDIADHCIYSGSPARFKRKIHY